MTQAQEELFTDLSQEQAATVEGGAYHLEKDDYPSGLEFNTTTGELTSETVAVTLSGAAFRIGHTIVGNAVH